MADSNDTQSILVIGGPNTGKSHFAFQLFGRLRMGSSGVRLRHMPDNISLFEEGLERLNKGLAGAHTSTDAYLECILPLELPSKRQLDVCWPDYGGEQLYRQVNRRTIDQRWQERLSIANAWLLFVRLVITQRHKDILADPLSVKLPTSEEPKEDSEEPKEDSDESQEDGEGLSEQAKVLELLQMLLHVACVDLSKPAVSPVLGVVLSCWDEITEDEGVTPQELLRERAPLICQFIESNWKEESRFIMGLSSTEKPLSSDEPDEGYVQDGPESFGFSIDSDGTKSKDLTLPISRLLDRMETNAS